MSALNRVLERLENVHAEDEGYKASCPVPTHGQGHGDRDPSLSVGVDAEGNVLLKCFANCENQARGELLALRWDDADLERGTLRVGCSLTREKGRYYMGDTKTKKGRRRVNLTPRAVAALKAHRKRQLEERVRLAELYEDRGLVFFTQTGAIVSPENLIKRSFKPLLNQAGLPEIRFHDLRHTGATLLLGRGVHPKLVQELLGHATVAMTLDTYSHYLPSMGDQASGAMEDAFG